jgi:tRNA threonylcarbamoyl adenosine modification protein (Sua5/YciO/YrdC/YwlC family)
LDALTSIEEISHLFGLKAKAKPVTGFCLDSRTLQAGELFLPLTGASFDGHHFVDEALKKGASGILSSRPAPAGFHEVWLHVPSPHPLSLLQQLATWWRQKHNPVLLAIGGSVGKTSTKALIEAYLCRAGIQALVTKGSENGFLGLSKTLLSLRAHHKCAVIEIGIDAPGAMASHVQWVDPDLALLTSITEEHLETLQNIETIFKEQRLLLDYVSKKGGKVLIQDEDPTLRTLANLPGAFRVGPQSPDFEWNYPHGRFKGEGPREYLVPHLAPQLYGNLGLALGASFLLGVPPTSLSLPLKAFEVPGPRARVEDWGDRTVLVDYYNAQPASMRAALAWLKSRPESKKIAVLGDMLELGPRSQEFHQALLPELKGLHVALIGSASGMGALRDHVPFFEHQGALLEWLKDQFQADSVLLLKASRGLRLERIHTALYAQYEAPIWEPTDRGLQQAKEALRSDGLLGLPTETVYGLAALASSRSAIEKVFDVKKRPRTSPLILHVSPDWGSIEVLQDKGWIDASSLDLNLRTQIQRLTKEAWPGPLTLLFPAGPACLPEISAGTGWVGIRCPSHPVAQALLRAIETPLVAPSANLFGRISPTQALDVVRDLRHPALKGVLDAGECSLGIESTVVQPREGQFWILRPGAFTREHFSQLGIEAQGPQTSGKSLAPGATLGHYAPKKPLSLWSPRDTLQDKSGLLIWHEAQRPPESRCKEIRVIAPSGTGQEMIRFFFKNLRALDEGPSTTLLIAPVPKEAGPHQETLEDRLLKAIAGSGKGTP